jgi:hypothetical protein
MKRGRVASAASAHALILGCSATYQTGQPTGTLPRLTPEDAVLFDDSFSPEVLGVGAEPADRDPELPARVERSDRVESVAISTVTADTDGTEMGYQLTFQPIAPSLPGSRPSDPIVITVRPTSASYAFVKTADMALVGGRYVLFWRRYGEGGRAVLHWHAVMDTPEMRRAVEQARPHSHR